MKLNKVLFVVAVAACLLFLLATLASEPASGCNGGRCEDPLPTQAQTRACDGPGVGPQHKCGEEAATATPVTLPTPTPIVLPTATPVIPPTPTRGVAITDTPNDDNDDKPDVTATPVVTATTTTMVGFPPATACGDEEVCDPCSLLLQALEDGMAIVITNSDNVTMIDQGSVVVKGRKFATGLLSQTR